jgi:hypothetical protein
MGMSDTHGPDILRHWQSWLLIPILTLAFLIAYIPHRDYAFPVHLDEWQVMVYTDELMAQGSLANASNPLSGTAGLTWNQTGELGDHIFWGIFREVAGLDWLPIFRYFPGIIFMMVVLGVFALANRLGFGREGALFASLIPTTVGILGPAFLVPIALAMVFIPLALFTVFYLRGWRSYLVLMILIVAPAAIHPPTAAVLLVVLVPYGLLCLRGEWRHSLGMALAVGLPFAVLFPVIYRMAIPFARRLLTEQSLNPYVDLPSVIPELGYITVVLFILGTVFLTWKGGKERYGLVLGTGLLLVVLAAFYTLHYGTEIVYYRGLLVGMLLVSVVAGAGLGAGGWVLGTGDQGTGSGQSPGHDHGHGSWWWGVRLGLTVGIVVGAVGVGVTARVNEPFYHMVEAADYRAFGWIGENMGEGYGRGLVDPWQGIAFVSVTGKPVYSLVGDKPDGNASAANAFLEGGGGDTGLLVKNKIDIVYASQQLENADLNEIRANVYILR